MVRCCTGQETERQAMNYASRVIVALPFFYALAVVAAHYGDSKAWSSALTDPLVVMGSIFVALLNGLFTAPPSGSKDGS